MAVLNNVLDSNFYPIALSFSVPPKYAAPNGNLLMTVEGKKEGLISLGIEPIFMDFNNVKDLSPTEFLEQILKKYNPGLISFGFDFCFGKNALGNANLIKAFCDEKNIEYKIAPPITALGQTVSSSVIRQYVAKGDMPSADIMLGRHFSFEGKVIRGDQRGRTIGFPTINQEYPKELVAPKFGVYASCTEIEGEMYNSVTNIGHRPTFKTENVTAETYIFDFKENAYGKSAKVNLINFLREEEKFASLNELKAAIEADKIKALKNLHSI
jgi:riboflavin kinase/FMN adenylyltransferase